MSLLAHPCLYMHLHHSKYDIFFITFSRFSLKISHNKWQNFKNFACGGLFFNCPKRLFFVFVRHQGFAPSISRLSKDTMLKRFTRALGVAHSRCCLQTSSPFISQSNLAKRSVLSIPINRAVEEQASRNQRRFQPKADSRARPKKHNYMDDDVYRGRNKAYQRSFERSTWPPRHPRMFPRQQFQKTHGCSFSHPSFAKMLQITVSRGYFKNYGSHLFLENRKKVIIFFSFSIFVSRAHSSTQKVLNYTMLCFILWENLSDLMKSDIIYVRWKKMASNIMKLRPLLYYMPVRPLRVGRAGN